MYDDLYKKLRPLLSQTHPDIYEVQALRFELAEARAKTLRELLELRVNRLRPKDKEWTDLDRKVELEAFTAELEQTHRFLDDLWVIVSDLIKMAETGSQEQSQKD